MEELRTWIITLVTVTVLCSIIEKFAPQGNLNKYVKLICGLSVTVVMAMPVLNLAKSDFKLDDLAWNDYMRLSEGELKRRIERLQKEDSKQMLEVYRSSLINDIKGRFRGNEEFSVAAADAVLYEDPDDEHYCMVRIIYLTLEPTGMNSSKTINKTTIDHIKKQLTEVFAINENQIIIELSGFNEGG
ncbi:MAG: stage III sporulation protein AF [Clostridiaceae bacterium]|jgi:stage III sporulation protein AF|nr:stage III sporulation protein AF [Clostridiaceae bacterium]